MGDKLLSSYIAVAIFLIVGLIFPAVLIWLNLILGPKIKEKDKKATFECGELPIGYAWHQYKVQFYIYAILLVIFDVEILFFYPWATVYAKYGYGVFFAGMLFLLLIFIGLLYEWKKGILEWEVNVT